jgi:hypothetical protein
LDRKGRKELDRREEGKKPPRDVAGAGLIGAELLGETDGQSGGWNDGLKKQTRRKEK